ncbi:MAG TPA: iron ABC transporter permease [Elusimicrobiales bacterium]|nr:iron ABC transporter permease [Elusimicrobiales bacterium]
MKNSSRYALLLLGLLAAAIAGVFSGAVQNPDLEMLLRLRLPRTLLAALAGAALGCCGSVMQAVLRNPLADPYIMGTSAGAGLGAVCALALGLQTHGPGFYALAFAGAFCATAFAYFMARAGGKTSAATLVLSGVMVSSFCGALILFFMIARQKESLPALLFIMGSVNEGSPSQLLGSAALFLGGAAALLPLSRRLDAISFGEEKAFYLGVNTERLKLRAMLGAALLACAAVGAAGTVGFIGLAVPHLMRALFGPNNRRLLFVSALCGAGALMAVDAAARTLLAPAEIPAGLLCALCGAPFFLYLLKRSKNEFF